MNCRIDILLSTYNGAEYLEQQLASIAVQVFSGWRLIARDDGSSDTSLEILKAFADEHPDRVELVTVPAARLGVVASYEMLLNSCSAPYIAFCDQDDIWLPDKLGVLLARMQSLESEAGSSRPCLVHSDLSVIGADREHIADSLWIYQKLEPAKMQSLERLLVQGCVTACASMMNRALLQRVVPIPQDVIMHDWWISLIAASNGAIAHIDDVTVCYRQHGANDTGAKQWGLRYIANGLIQGRKHYKQSIQRTRLQARALLDSGRLDDGQAAVVERYVGLPSKNGLHRRIIAIRSGFLKYGMIRNIAFFLWM